MKDILAKNFPLICAWIAFLGGLIIILEFLISPINTRLIHIEEQVNNHIPTQIREVNQRLDQTNQRLDQSLDQINQRLDQINQRLDQTNQRLDQTQDQINQRLDNIYKALIDNKKAR